MPHLTTLLVPLALMLQAAWPMAVVTRQAPHDTATRTATTGTDAAGTASIAGVVLRADTREPIAGAGVFAAPAGQEGGWLLRQLTATAPPFSLPQATTDGRGRFLITDLNAGTYLVVAQRSGFARQQDALHAGLPGTRLTVVAGRALHNVVMSLVPGGVISGRVTNDAGEAVAGMTVLIQRSGYGADGQKRLTSAAESRTNDRGEYRAYWLTPGTYYALVEPLRSDPEEIAQAGYVATYYPGSADQSAAAAIEVTPGVEVAAIDFTVTRQRVFRVRGDLPLSDTGLGPDLIWLVSKNPVPDGGNREGTIIRGRFEIRNVAPGSYRVHASAGEVPLFDGDVDVIGTDVDNVVLSSRRGFTVKGRVRREGVPLSSSQHAQLWITLDPIGSPEASSADERSSRSTPDGSLQFVAVLPGRYGVRAGRLPPDTYIKSVRLGGADVLDDVAVSGPVDALEIVLSTSAGQLEGTTVDERGRPMANIEAVLLPVREAHRTPARVRTTVSDQDGRFALNIVPPGDYKLFAWDHLDTYGFYDVDFVRRYEARGMAIRVTEQSRQQVQLTVLRQR